MNEVLLPSPREVKQQLALLPSQSHFIQESRETAKNILEGKDKRLAIIAGPCSIHETEEALDYAQRFKELAEKVDKSCFLVMRAYIEKPRTTTGWKGLLYDPYLDGSNDMKTGIYWSRQLLLNLAEMGIPTATEFVDPLTAAYVDDLITWGFVGARTSASQTHRQLASSLNFPVGFKNGTDGNLDNAIQGVVAAKQPHSFMYIDPNGRVCAAKSSGNPSAHVVLRGSLEAPNYDPQSVRETLEKMRLYDIIPRILVDCAHGNSQKQYQKQRDSFRSVINQILEGNGLILGAMLESNLYAGNQILPERTPSLRYAVSVTDPCIDWDTTQELIGWADSVLGSSLSLI